MQAAKSKRSLGVREAGPRDAAQGNERGSQLFEFALVLPLLCVLLVGITDFAQAYILRQKLTNAAREGARIASQQDTQDLDQTIPPSVQSVRNAVVQYLDEAGIDVTSTDANPTSTGFREWTYSRSGNVLLVINRAGTVQVNGLWIELSRVTVSYPFSWTFHEVIRLMVPSASYSSSFLVTSDAEMRNLR